MPPTDAPDSSNPATPAEGPASRPSINDEEWFGPIFRWEMIAQSRRWQTYTLRVAYAGLLAFLLGCFVFGSQSNASGNVWEWMSKRTMSVDSNSASYFALMFNWAMMACVLFVTPIFVAPTIASERERKTIEYLFVTPLTNREIVFGKLLASGSAMMTILLSGAPILAMAGLFGGIDYANIGWSLAASLALLFSVSTFSILISAITETSRKATTGTYQWMFLILISPGLLLAIGGLLMLLAEAYGLDAWLLSIYETLAYATAPLWVVHPFAYWSFLSGHAMALQSVVSWDIRWLTFFFVAEHTLLGLFFLWVGCVDLRRAYYRHEAQEAALIVAATTGLPKKSIPVWERWPIAWKEYRASYVKRRPTKFQRGVGLIVIAAAIIYGLYSLTSFGPKQVAENIPIIAAYVGVGVAINAVTRAHQSLNEEANRDCLTSFLMIPASAREIIWQKALGNMFWCARFIVWMVPIWLISWYFSAVSFVGVMTVLIAFLSLMLPILGLGLLTGMNVKALFVFIVLLITLNLLDGLGFFHMFSPLPEFLVEYLIPASAIRESYLDDGAGVWDLVPKLKVLGAAVVYAVVGVALLEYAARRFPKFSGRIE